MNHLINQLMTVDKAFYRHYLEMLLTLNRIQALTPWRSCCVESQDFSYRCSILNCCALSLCTEQEKDEIRFMKGWKLRERAGEK